MDQEIVKKNEFIQYLAWKKFKYVLTPGQVEIVRKIVFREEKRLCVSAYTQYGKTFSVTIAIAILIEKYKTKVAFIGPKQEQAGILREYMADLILKDPDLLKKAMLFVTGSEKIQREASRKRMTFTNGSEYRVFSAEGEADRLMGFGVGIEDGIGIIVKDESCLISKKANVKIGRMMGNNPENCILIELYNPWTRDNVTFEHTNDPEFDVINIGWRQGVREGRTTKKFIMEQAKELGGMDTIDFTVLYKSKFPLEAEDSLYNLAKIEIAEHQTWDFEKNLQELLLKLKNAHKYTEKEIRLGKEELKKYRRIISCDPAEKGRDETVIFWGVQYETKYQLVGSYWEPKSEPTDVVGRLVDYSVNFIGRRVQGLINIDRIGIGSGPFSFLKQELKAKRLKNIKVCGCHYGESAIKKDMFLNKKAENYFRSQAIFREELIRIPKERKLRNQMVSMRWDRTSASKKKIVDPDKSPDWADALCYFTWRDKKGLAFGFG